MNSFNLIWLQNVRGLYFNIQNPRTHQNGIKFEKFEPLKSEIKANHIQVGILPRLA
jgi:hypothetical protein